MSLSNKVIGPNQIDWTLLEEKYPNSKEILHYLKTRKRIKSFPIQNLTMFERSNANCVNDQF